MAPYRDPHTRGARQFSTDLILKCRPRVGSFAHAVGGRLIASGMGTQNQRPPEHDVGPWAGYGRRVRQVARRYQQRLDERVNERTRIARELHDTPLQRFHGLLLQFQTAAYLLPERPAEARAQLDGAIVHAARAITEGRDAVQGLRASTLERNDLAIAIRTLGDALASDANASTPSQFNVAVEAETRDLHPIVRDELIDGMEISGQELNNYPLAIAPLDPPPISARLDSDRLPPAADSKESSGRPE
jgi:signal transduction histidine kinase